MFNIKTALAGGGVTVAITAFLLGNFTGEQVKPVDNLAQPLLAPAERVCPGGWTDTSTSDEHAPISSCFKNGWTVWLQPDGEFSHALLDGESEFTFCPHDCGPNVKSPGWPK